MYLFGQSMETQFGKTQIKLGSGLAPVLQFGISQHCNKGMSIGLLVDGHF
jgi:hypothetical protein